MILATDLSNAFDLIDHQILLQKFEHIGVRGKAYQVIQSYLEDRNYFCEVQGFHGTLKKCRPYSVIQGGKLSGQFFGVYTLEMVKISQMLRNENSKLITAMKEYIDKMLIPEIHLAWGSEIEPVALAVG